MNISIEMNSRVGEALGRLGSSFSTSECHGALVGLLSAKGSLGEREWLGYVAPGSEADLLAGESRKVLTELLDDTARQLNDPGMGFEPLLPEEDEPLVERVEALGEWCQGYLLGLSEGGVKQESLPSDAAEIVGDFVNLSQAGNYAVSGGEEDESAYFELVEYVRTGVLLVNEELNPIKAPPRSGGRLH